MDTSLIICHSLSVMAIWEIEFSLFIRFLRDQKMLDKLW